MSARFILITAALLGALAVMLGAFAAHGLRDQLSPRLLDVFRTGVDYQFWHVAALMAVGLLQQRARCFGFSLSAAAFLTGVLLFSGSLYVLALSGVHWLGAITPLGGTAFIIGWLSLAVTLIRQGKQNADSGER